MRPGLLESVTQFNSHALRQLAGFLSLENHVFAGISAQNE